MLLSLRRRPSTRPAALRRGDAAFVSGLRVAGEPEGASHAAWALYLMLLMVAACFGWAALTRVDDITKAEGRVVPDGREQVISSLEGGLLSELFVHEGMQVDRGQRLAQIDPTRFQSQQNEGQSKRLALKATLARLTAEANGQLPRFPPEVAAVPALVNSETEAYQARLRSVQQAVEANQRSIALLQKEKAMAEAMAAKGLLSDVEVMRLARQVNELQLQSQERLNRFRQEASTEQVRVRDELVQIDEQMSGRADILRRTVLTSPVHGLVKNIRASTVGGVIAPGAPVMEIVPLGPRVLIEARIKPADIGFVRVGQAVQVMLSAYEFTSYGALKGKIEYISPDALGDPDRAANADATYYRALIRADTANLQAGNKTLPVLPGMTGSVEVRTGERSVLDYLLRPMLKSKQAFREG